MIKTIEERIIHHLPNRYKDTLNCYKCFEHEDWEEFNDEGELVGFVSYFFLDFKHDMIITAAKDNRFSKAQWRVIRDAVKYRSKPIRIQSDPNNKVLHRVAKSYGGEFYDDEIFFGEPDDNK
jgi:hypothetical protein